MNTLLYIARALKVSIRGLHEGWRRHPPGRPHHSRLRTLKTLASTQHRSRIIGSRTLDALRGNRYAPALDMRTMIMIQH